MKTCPYCAEEIQDAASYCRFCNKKVKGIRGRRVFMVIILIAAALVIYAHREELNQGRRRIAAFCKEVTELLSEAKENIRHMSRQRRQLDEMLGAVKK